MRFLDTTHSIASFALGKNPLISIDMKQTNYKSIYLFILMIIGLQGFAQDPDIAAGEKLFKNNCASCHAYDEKVVIGPGLKGIEERRDYAWIKAWINNPAKVLASGDTYANDLYNQYNKIAMTAFPAFGDTEIKSILAYVNDASSKPAEVAVAAGAATTGSSSESNGGGQFFNIVLVALLLIMGLVLVALLAVLSLLSKIAGVDSKGNLPADASFGDIFQQKVKAVFNNSTVRTAIITMFVLLGTKATFDGLFSIGVSQGYAPTQPIAFSHKLHAGEMEINCAYCHTGVYKGKQAGIPSSNICMNCHNEVKRESPEIQKIYTAALNDQPVEWIRVHNLPDLAYFNHAQHTNVAGLDCANCHGEINKMEVVQQRSSLTMGWCIDCHRKTEVNGKDNAYYDALMTAHNETYDHTMKVEDMGGLECAKCHY